MNDTVYLHKYLKYKNKYLYMLGNKSGGMDFNKAHNYVVNTHAKTPIKQMAVVFGDGSGKHYINVNNNIESAFADLKKVLEEYTDASYELYGMNGKKIE